MSIHIKKNISNLPVYFILVLILLVQSSISVAQLKSKTDLRIQKTNMKTPYKAIIDADYTLEEALAGSRVPFSVKKNLELITVTYYGFDSSLHQGRPEN